MAVLRSTTDGVVVLQPSLEPRPIGRIVVGDSIVGWIDYATDRAGDIAIRYDVSATDRGDEYAARAVQLLVHHLALLGTHCAVSLSADPTVGAISQSRLPITSPRPSRSGDRSHGARSLAVAQRAGFVQLDGGNSYRRAIPPLSYSDGSVTIRRQRTEDLEADLTAKDHEQINWLWLPGHHEAWQAMTPEEQRAHAARTLAASRDAFGAGPKWSFSVDATDADYVAYVDCDLANAHVPAGEANISYASHPAHRGRGYVSRAVLLICRFIVEHTGARRAYLIVDAENVASIRVARGVGAQEVERWSNERGRVMIRHELCL